MAFKTKSLLFLLEKKKTQNKIKQRLLYKARLHHLRNHLKHLGKKRHCPLWARSLCKYSTTQQQKVEAKPHRAAAEEREQTQGKGRVKHPHFQDTAPPLQALLTSLNSHTHQSQQTRSLWARCSTKTSTEAHTQKGN